MADKQNTDRPAHASDTHTEDPRLHEGVSQMDSSPDEVCRIVLIAAARLLAYPASPARAALAEIAAALRQLPASDATAMLADVARRLLAMDLVELETRYVATFDFNEATALYLTAHELQDSRRRGQALVELRSLLRASGFEEVTDELPDYLPLLLEFVAYAPPAVPSQPVKQRLAAVCARIRTAISDDNPYREVFVALLDVLPQPAQPNSEQSFPDREQADTGEMPYPLRYD